MSSAEHHLWRTTHSGRRFRHCTPCTHEYHTTPATTVWQSPVAHTCPNFGTRDSTMQHFPPAWKMPSLFSCAPRQPPSALLQRPHESPFDSPRSGCQDVQTGLLEIYTEVCFNQLPQTGAPGCWCASAGHTTQASWSTHTAHGDHTQESTRDMQGQAQNNSFCMQNPQEAPEHCLSKGHVIHLTATITFPRHHQVWGKLCSRVQVTRHQGLPIQARRLTSWTLANSGHARGAHCSRATNKLARWAARTHTTSVHRLAHTVHFYCK